MFSNPVSGKRSRLFAAVWLLALSARLAYEDPSETTIQR